mmetsp:Transcript_48042/g.91839  ORF Transcript_48042/g.91839 Transcript_48042/m.91839 type:complete len:398 (+) Transcript_48042:880-2073(+)
MQTAQPKRPICLRECGFRVFPVHARCLHSHKLLGSSVEGANLPKRAVPDASRVEFGNHMPPVLHDNVREWGIEAELFQRGPEVECPWVQLCKHHHSVASRCRVLAVLAVGHLAPRQRHKHLGHGLAVNSHLHRNLAQLTRYERVRVVLHRLQHIPWQRRRHLCTQSVVEGADFVFSIRTCLDYNRVVVSARYSIHNNLHVRDGRGHLSLYKHAQLPEEGQGRGFAALRHDCLIGWAEQQLRGRGRDDHSLADPRHEGEEERARGSLHGWHHLHLRASKQAHLHSDAVARHTLIQLDYARHLSARRFQIDQPRSACVEHVLLLLKHKATLGHQGIFPWLVNAMPGQTHRQHYFPFFILVLSFQLVQCSGNVRRLHLEVVPLLHKVQVRNRPCLHVDLY